MARRSRRNNSRDTAQGIVALIFLVALGMTGGNLQLAMELLLPLVIIGIVLAATGAVLYLLFRNVGRANVKPKFSRNFRNDEPASINPGFPRNLRNLERASVNPGFSRNLTHEAPVGVLSVSAPVTAGPVMPEKFTQELLNQLEWRRFEMLVQALFQAEGLSASRIRAGADGGIDLSLRESPEGPVTAIVQCKAWKAYTVGVKPVRELFGVMHAEGVPRSLFFTSGRFTSEALAFARGKPMDLIDGNALLLRLNSLEESKRDSIRANITAGDYTTPTCPSCETKMVRRTSRHGEFWGCRSYPLCKKTFNVRT